MVEDRLQEVHPVIETDSITPRIQERPSSKSRLDGGHSDTHIRVDTDEESGGEMSYR